VARLEGIPLALALAAARVRSLAVAAISSRLKDRCKLLTGGGRVLLERQQTWRALVDWSCELRTGT
jgi:predicted ATPase